MYPLKKYCIPQFENHWFKGYRVQDTQQYLQETERQSRKLSQHGRQKGIIALCASCTGAFRTWKNLKENYIKTEVRHIKQHRDKKTRSNHSRGCLIGTQVPKFSLKNHKMCSNLILLLQPQNV